MYKQMLFVNACVRKDSRTEKLARKLLSKLNKPFEEVYLNHISFPSVDEEYLTKRDKFIATGEFENGMFDLARQFSNSETIVIAAPYWDLSFPAKLKQYLEQVSVVGITFKYSDRGEPIGLCKASKLYYITTAGGNYVPDVFGFGYVSSIARDLFGIPEVIQFKASGLDIYGADVDKILADVEKDITETKI